MSTILSRYLPTDTPALRKEFETAYADELDALYQRFLASKARECLEKEHPGLLTMPVERLGLPSRTVTALKRKSIDTVTDLLPFSAEDLARVKGISYESAAEIMASIRSLLE